MSNKEVLQDMKFFAENYDNGLGYEEWYAEGGSSPSRLFPRGGEAES